MDARLSYFSMYELVAYRGIWSLPRTVSCSKTLSILRDCLLDQLHQTFLHIHVNEADLLGK